MKMTCTRYFVDVGLLNDGVPVDELEKHSLQELPSAYEALLSPHEIGAKGNLKVAENWKNFIASPQKFKKKKTA
jgi:hypothetical protein